MHNETKFSVPLVELINNAKNDLSGEKHIFITPHEKVYLATNSLGKVILDESNVNLINKYAPFCKWIFVHNMSYRMLLGCKNKNLKKIIFRYWGNGLGSQYVKNNPIKNTGKFIVNSLFFKKLSKIAAVGIANSVDEIEVSKYIKNMKYYYMPYGIGDGLTKINKLMKEENKTGSQYKIMLGHSGYEINNHIEILQKLARFGDKIKVFVPLSYGKTEYIKEVKEYIEKNCQDNVVVLDGFLPPDEYIKLLWSFDAAIFASKNSCALGNIEMLVCMKKKIFLNREGTIREAFNQGNVPSVSIDEIDDMTFEQLCEPLPDYDLKNCDLAIASGETNRARWQKIIADFN